MHRHSGHPADRFRQAHPLGAQLGSPPSPCAGSPPPQECMADRITIRVWVSAWYVSAFYHVPPAAVSQEAMTSPLRNDQVVSKCVVAVSNMLFRVSVCFPWDSVNNAGSTT